MTRRTLALDLGEAIVRVLSAHGVVPLTFDGRQFPRQESHGREVFTYFIRAARAGLVKIGHSVDPDERMASLQTANGDDLEMIGHARGGHDLERYLHKRLGVHRRRGEWFTLAPEVAAVIAEVLSASDPLLRGTRS
jgi:hypothetical protein